MLKLVVNPQEYVYIMSLSHLEQLLECISRNTHAYRFTYHQFCMGGTQCAMVRICTCNESALRRLCVHARSDYCAVQQRVL